MEYLINLENKHKPSNCVSHHDDICFAEHDQDKDNQD